MTSFRTKSGRNQVRFGSSKQLTKVNFLGEFVLAPKHLWATIGPWRLHNRWVCSGTPPSLTCIFFFPSVRFSFNGGQAGEQYLQVKSNINTLYRIAELPQIYLHLNDCSWRVWPWRSPWQLRHVVDFYTRAIIVTVAIEFGIYSI